MSQDDWQNPITKQPGQVQTNVDPARLRPSRKDLYRIRIEFQRSLLLAGTQRLTPISVTRDGVIYDGHHGVRAAAEDGIQVDVLIIDQTIPATAASIFDLPVK